MRHCFSKEQVNDYIRTLLASPSATSPPLPTLSINISSIFISAATCDNICSFRAVHPVPQEGHLYCFGGIASYHEPG